MGYSMCIGGKSFHHPPPAMTATKAQAQAQYDAALAAYRAIPSRGRKAKHAAAERLVAAREALNAAA